MRRLCLLCVESVSSAFSRLPIGGHARGSVAISRFYGCLKDVRGQKSVCQKNNPQKTSQLRALYLSLLHGSFLPLFSHHLAFLLFIASHCSCLTFACCTSVNLPCFDTQTTYGSEPVRCSRRLTAHFKTAAVTRRPGRGCSNLICRVPEFVRQVHIVLGAKRK